MRLFGFLIGMALMGGGMWLGVRVAEPGGRPEPAVPRELVARSTAPAPATLEAAQLHAWQDEVRVAGWLSRGPAAGGPDPTDDTLVLPAPEPRDEPEPQAFVQYHTPDGRLGFADSAANVPAGAQILALGRVSSAERDDRVRVVAADGERSRAEIEREAERLRLQNLADSEAEASWRATANWEADRARREAELERDLASRADAGGGAPPGVPASWP